MGVSESAITRLLDREAELFARRTPRSRAALARMGRKLPRSVTSGFQSHYPYPLLMESGSGQWVQDLDGNRYLDLHTGFGASLCGHAHPVIREAVERQLRVGWHYAAPHPGLETFTELLSARFSLDQLQLCASGSEATMGALRLALSHSDRREIVMVAGSYHGHHELAMRGAQLSEQGELELRQRSEGLLSELDARVQLVDFNDLEGLALALAREPACLIMEPVMMNLGLLLPQPDYHREVRELCDRYGVLLIWDEVKSGAVIAAGGAQELWPEGQPDLVCLGKAVGGGMPVGVFGGRRELMRPVEEGRVPQYGTWNGHPLSCAAGEAALGLLQPEFYARAQAMQRALLQRVEGRLEQHGLSCHSVCLGAKGGLFTGPCMPSGFRAWKAQVGGLLGQSLWLWSVNRGVWWPAGADEQWTISTQVTEQDLELLGETIGDWAEALSHAS